MSEKIPNPEINKPNSPRCEELLANNIEDIYLYLQIFNELPDDIYNLEAENNKYNSLIVVTDEKSFAGRYAAEYMIEYDELEKARDDLIPPEVAVGILTRDESRGICDRYYKKDLNLPQVDKDIATILVISDESMYITVDLNLLQS